MTTKNLDLGFFNITVPVDWDNITSTLDEANPPLTVANPEAGVGALQFSSANYKGGKLPDVRLQDLTELLSDFAVNRDLGEPFDSIASPDGLAIAAASFQSGDDLIRVWFVSDGKSVILATYVSDWDQRDSEAGAREAVVRSIRFKSGAGTSR